ncbi:MAG TPA: serine hydrolase domain-containing protein [Sphingomicrobium sp.]|nr:serine hydrolase domain-containing protein [Sphingomicrobium sp.]
MLRRTVLIAAALTAAAIPSFAQTTAPVTATARTPAESAVRAVLAAINGNHDARSALVNAAYSSKALQNESADSRLKWLDRIAKDSGGLTVVSSTPQGDRMVEAIVRTNRGGKFGKLVLFTSKTEAGKISDLFLLAARDPAKVKAEAWPTGPIPVPRVASEVEKHAAALAAEDSFSGVVLVAKGDEVLVNRAYGLADQEWKAPNRTDTLFHMASVGKMFTAAAILKLAGEGKLSLDDTLAKWVPEYPHPEAAKITLKQLLTHSAGIGDWDGRQVRGPHSGAELAATMTEPLQFEPGARFNYSNAGFVLLQAVVEKATGKSFAAALQDLVFAPAGMKRTGLWPVTAIMPNRATGYLRPEDDPLGLGPRYANAQFLGYDGNGSGGEYSTAADMLAFNRAIATGKLLGQDLTTEMLTPRIDFAGAQRPSKYGYGVDLGTCSGHATFGHGGGGPNSGVSSVDYYVRDGDWSIIVLSNYDPPAAEDLAFSVCEFVAGR